VTEVVPLEAFYEARSTITTTPPGTRTSLHPGGVAPKVEKLRRCMATC